MSRSWCWEYVFRQSASPGGKKPWAPTLMPNKLDVVVNSIWMQEYQKFRLILRHILSTSLAQEKRDPITKGEKQKGGGLTGNYSASCLFLRFLSPPQRLLSLLVTDVSGVCVRGLSLSETELNEHYRERRCRREGDRSGPLTAVDLLQC